MMVRASTWLQPIIAAAFCSGVLASDSVSDAVHVVHQQGALRGSSVGVVVDGLSAEIGQESSQNSTVITQILDVNMTKSGERRLGTGPLNCVCWKERAALQCGDRFDNLVLCNRGCRRTCMEGGLRFHSCAAAMEVRWIKRLPYSWTPCKDP